MILTVEFSKPFPLPIVLVRTLGAYSCDQGISPLSSPSSDQIYTNKIEFHARQLRVVEF